MQDILGNIACALFVLFAFAVIATFVAVYGYMIVEILRDLWKEK
jgi:hypothetical protein